MSAALGFGLLEFVVLKTQPSRADADIIDVRKPSEAYADVLGGPNEAPNSLVSDQRFIRAVDLEHAEADIEMTLEETEAEEYRQQVELLLQALESLPTHPTIALRVLWLIDDPTSNVAKLAKVVELDPLLSAQLIRISNSAYYSLRTPVTNVPRAIAALGFATVRTLAASSAAGLSEDQAVVPQDFWTYAAGVANAAQLLAPRYFVPPSDAFALGLLHNLGEALLQQASPSAWEELGQRHTLDEEHKLFGVSHADAGARVLEAWRFPGSFCEAVANHHRKLSPRETPLTRCLIASQLVADLALNRLSFNQAETARILLGLEGIEDESLDRYVSRVKFEAASLAAVLDTAEMP